MVRIMCARWLAPRAHATALAAVVCASPVVGCSSDDTTQPTLADGTDAWRKHHDAGQDAQTGTDAADATSDTITSDAGTIDAAPADAASPTPADSGGTLPADQTDCTVTRCHYVRSGASGTGDDWNNAYPSLPATLVRGDTYFIAAGSYPATTFGTAASGTTAITIKKAIDTDHGTSVGWSSSYGAGQAIFDGGIAFSSPYWTFDGRTGGGPGSWQTGFGFRVNHTTDPGVAVTSTGDNVTIRHVELQGALIDGVIGFSLKGADNFTVSYWYTENIGNCPFFMVPVSNFLAEYGYVGKYSGSTAAHSEIASIWGGVTGTTTFRFNVFANVLSTGGLMWDNHEDHTAQLRVYGNIFYKSATSTWNNDANGLIGGWTGGNGEDFYNARIYNNTFYNTTGRIFTNFVLRSGNNEATDNLFYNSDTPYYDDIQTHDYNHYINSGGSQSEPNGTSAASGDPAIDAAGLDFRLTAATPAGASLSAPFTVDPNGTLRGADGIWDRGAFEFSAP